MHKSKSVIASAAKQSIFACPSITYGSPRRCTPRDDAPVQIFLSSSKPREYLFLILPRGITAVVMVARTGSPPLGALGGEVSFLGFLASLLVFC